MYKKNDLVMDEEKEESGQNVEDEMGISDGKFLVRNEAFKQSDEFGKRGNDDQEDHSSDQVEKNINVERGLGLLCGGDGDDEACDRGAHVGSEHDADGGLQADGADCVKILGESDGDARGLEERADEGAAEKTVQGVFRKQEHHVQEVSGFGNEGQSRVHDVDAEEEDSEADNHGSDGADPLLSAEEKDVSQDDEDQTEFFDLEREDEGGRGGADVRPDHNHETLGEREKVGAD